MCLPVTLVVHRFSGNHRDNCARTIHFYTLNSLMWSDTLPAINHFQKRQHDSHFGIAYRNALASKNTDMSNNLAHDLSITIYRNLAFTSPMTKHFPRNSSLNYSPHFLVFLLSPILLLSSSTFNHADNIAAILLSLHNSDLATPLNFDPYQFCLYNFPTYTFSIHNTHHVLNYPSLINSIMFTSGALLISRF